MSIAARFLALVLGVSCTYPVLAQDRELSDFPVNVQHFINRIAVGHPDAALYRDFVTDETFMGDGLTSAIMLARNINRDGPCPRVQGLVAAIQWDATRIGKDRVRVGLQNLARNPNFVGRDGARTLLSECAFGQNIHNFVRGQLLVSAGADSNETTKDPRKLEPALFRHVGLKDVLRNRDTSSDALLNQLLLGADPNARDALGRTALMVLMRSDRFYSRAR